MSVRTGGYQLLNIAFSKSICQSNCLTKIELKSEMLRSHDLHPIIQMKYDDHYHIKINFNVWQGFGCM